MASLLPIAVAVLPHEPCAELAELNKVSARPGAGLRRMQIMRIVRSDLVYEHTRDLGPASAFGADEFIIPAMVRGAPGHYEVLSTVERLQNVANEYRAKYDKPTERFEPDDLVKGFEEFATRRREARLGRTHFAMRSQR